MDSTRHSILRNKLLLTLNALPGSASSRGLIEFSGAARAAAMLVLDDMRSRGWLSYDGGVDTWEKKAGQLWEGATAEARLEADGPGTGTDDPVLEGLVCLYDGRWLESGEIFLRAIRVFLKKGSSAGALVCLDLLALALRNIIAPGVNENEDARFVAVYKEFLGAALFMSKRLEAALSLLDKARRTSTAWGDVRSVLMLNLYEGCARQLAATHNTDIAFSHISNAIRGIKDFEDAELYDSIGPALGVYYQVEGDFREASKYLKERTQSQFLEKLDYFAELCTRYWAGGLVVVGRYGQAVGMLEGALREARLLHLPLQAKWRQAQLAQFLMWGGRRDEALELLDPVLCRTDPASETKLWIFCLRLLAFYFHHQGDVRRAHHIMTSLMRGVALQGDRRPFYGFPWLLELLWAFEKAGLPRIPGHDFERELSLALASPNKMFRGTALRIRAAVQELAGEKAQAVLETLGESLFYMESIRDPVGAARTKLALSRSLGASGASGEAEALYGQACEVLHAFGQHDCPEYAQCNEGKPAVYVPDGRAALESLRRQFDKELPLAENGYYAQRFVEAVCQELDMERAALFTAEDGELECVGVCNISPAERESPLFGPRRAWLLSRVGARAPDLVAENRRTALCLPVNAGDKRCLLFMEARYFPERITGQPAETFTGLAALLGDKLKLLLSVRSQMCAVLRRETSKAKEATVRLGKSGDVFVTPSMGHSMHAFDQAARSDASMLIMGETGVGKEGLARRAHDQSGRIGPFVPVHPGGMPENLFESEFFGHEKGAFTGAHQKKTGLFEIADKGTLFIDEVGDMPLPVQIKLLRVLQEKSFLRVGGVREVRSDFRLVTATNRDLEKMVAEGTFRRDLFYRISVIPFRIPSLRQRPEDIPFLAEKFIEHFSIRYAKPLARLSEQQRLQLLAYQWPGNVRELKSVLERAVILSSDGRLDLRLTNGGPKNGPAPVREREEQRLPPLWKGLPTMEELERSYIAHVLKVKKGRINGADGALAVLGMKRSTLYMKIRKYKLDAASQLYGEGVE